MREQLLAAYADAALQGLLTCEIAPGLQELRQQTPGSRWLSVQKINGVSGMRELLGE